MPFEDDVTKRVASESRGVRVWSVELVVVDGPSRGQRAHVPQGSARIGTAASCELRLTDPTVSRVHCELRARPDGISLRDCGSTNGTFVEGVRLKDGEIPPGALLRLGQSAVRVEVGDVPVLVELSDRTSFGELVGGSMEMRRLYAVLERVASSDTTLLVTGETGTGKDVVARSVHAASRRASQPYVAVDCGAIPEALIESELFGHVRGSFSGALTDRKGVIEEADGGTLFLDEIGDLPLALQPKLLRAIETRSIRRVGSNLERPVDVRIVAATNRPLARCVNDGTFREDLYYRLAVVEVALPPLRARREDIPRLAQHFYERFSATKHPLPEPFLSTLVARSWPGNVRELRNAIERCVSLGLVESHGTARVAPRAIAPDTTLASLVPLDLPLKDARQAWIESFEHVYVRALLRQMGGNITRAADRAGVSRRFLQRLVTRLGIKAHDVGARPEDLEGDG